MNPARPKRSVMGVHSWGLGQTFAEALKNGNCERAWVVCGREGLDEISIAGETDVWELRNGEIKHLVISPSSFGLPSHSLDHVRSGAAVQNAAVARYLFEPSSYTKPFPSGPLPKPLTFTPSASGSSVSGSDPLTIPAGTHLDAVLDYVLLQSAALLYVGGKAATLPDAVTLARASLRLGGASTALAQLATEAHRAGVALERIALQEREQRELQRISRKDDFYYAKDLRTDDAPGDVDSPQV